MKGLKLSLLIVAAAFMIMGVTGTTYAFHDGGVATCEGCHTMHESLNNSMIQISNGGTKQFPIGASQFNAANMYLLKGTDQSSTCLNCHKSADATAGVTGAGKTGNSYHIMSTVSGPTGIPVEMTPGGDFAWLSVGTTSTSNPGKHHGHNIVAGDFGLTSSTNYGATSPGGSYPVDKFYCSSCHDPHNADRIDSTGAIVSRAIGSNVGPIIAPGSYAKDDGSGPVESPVAGETVGVYRFLGGVNYLPKSISSVSAAKFTAAQPYALAPADYNYSEKTAKTRVAYGSGMSEWCANCHGSLLNNQADTTSTHRHPAGALAKLNHSWGNEMNNYNAYVASGDLSGSSATSYNTLVPYEMGTTSRATMGAAAGSNGGAPTVGPDANANVMCLSCHRAHATAFPEMTRWDMQGGQYLTMDDQYIGTDNYTTLSDSATANRIQSKFYYSTAQLQAAYYDRNPTDFGNFQRSLCNKCHAKD